EKAYAGFTYEATLTTPEDKTIAGDGSLVIRLYYTRNTDTAYTVEHYLENIDGTYPATPEATDTLSGMTGTTATYAEKAYAGFTYNASLTTPEDKTIIGDGSLVIRLYYTRNTDTPYKVEYFYEKDGQYPVNADFSDNTRTGMTGTYAEVKPEDRNPSPDVPGRYVFDNTMNQSLKLIITGDGETVLRVYFKQTFVVSYEPGAKGIFAVSTNDNLVYGDETPQAPATPGAEGYIFAGWDPKVEPTVTKDATYVAQWIPSDSTKYTVEFYYESEGKYPAQPNDTALRAGTTDALAAVTDADKAAPTGFILDTNAGNVFEAKVTGDGNMVLKVYFKQQFTVTYNPGDHGSFDAQTNAGLSYGDKTPAFSGQTTANGNYRFNGWDKEIADTVTGNAVYTAQWSYTGGGSGGGGGGGSTPGRVTPSEGGPGVTIMPEDVPLAQLPGSPVDTTLIDDGEIPLAGLPKTGQSSVKSTLTMMMSGIFLVLTAMSKKRKEEDS
ncbi:doubled motif LPXTG anchor domain-containing protein, partial [Enterocloster citroniae]|uniref:doubled motif LPXTG anchor domain-containing protein n=1 Tax=Enterocloster citroniae TaxID=358743 RepID=UPI002AD41B1B